MEVPPKFLTYRSCEMIQARCFKMLHFRVFGCEAIDSSCNHYEMPPLSLAVRHPQESAQHEINATTEAAL